MELVHKTGSSLVLPHCLNNGSVADLPELLGGGLGVLPTVFVRVGFQGLLPVCLLDLCHRRIACHPEHFIKAF